MEFTGPQSVVTCRWDCIFLNHIEKKSQTKLNQVLDGRVRDGQRWPSPLDKDCRLMEV